RTWLQSMDWATETRSSALNDGKGTYIITTPETNQTAKRMHRMMPVQRWMKYIHRFAGFQDSALEAGMDRQLHGARIAEHPLGSATVSRACVGLVEQIAAAQAGADPVGEVPADAEIGKRIGR